MMPNRFVPGQSSALRKSRYVISKIGQIVLQHKNVIAILNLLTFRQYMIIYSI